MLAISQGSGASRSHVTTTPVASTIRGERFRQLSCTRARCRSRGVARRLRGVSVSGTGKRGEAAHRHS